MFDERRGLIEGVIGFSLMFVIGYGLMLLGVMI
jgi:hypothetical protein